MLPFQFIPLANNTHTVNGDKYRFGFQGQEKDDGVAGEGNSNTAHFWKYDTRMARRWNLDPKPNPAISIYACFANNPIFYFVQLGDTITPLDGAENDPAFIKWKGSKEGKNFYKRYDIGGKRENVVVEIALVDLVRTSNGAGTVNRGLTSTEVAGGKRGRKHLVTEKTLEGIKELPNYYDESDYVTDVQSDEYLIYKIQVLNHGEDNLVGEISLYESQHVTINDFAFLMFNNPFHFRSASSNNVK